MFSGGTEAGTEAGTETGTETVTRKEEWEGTGRETGGESGEKPGGESVRFNNEILLIILFQAFPPCLQILNHNSRRLKISFFDHFLC